MKQLLILLAALVAAGCEAPKTAPTVGRYWARLQGAGTAEAGTAWFEYQAATETSWTTTPARAVSSGANLSALVEWISGLKPGTEYRQRLCRTEGGGAAECGLPTSFTTAAPTTLPWVIVDPEVTRHLKLTTGERFIVWGNNYVAPTGAPEPNLLVEDHFYDEAGFALIDADLERLTNLAPPDGLSNTIRMHLQLHAFLHDAVTPNREALARYARVVELAEDHGLYVMVTGLNYFYPADNPRWIAEQTDEGEHWDTQALWWNAMATALRYSPGAFSYDLMNEPYVSGGGIEPDGLARYTTVPANQYCDYGADEARGIHGTCFGQYVTAAPLGSRTAGEAAAQWVGRMVEAIRAAEHDSEVPHHLVTVGVGAFGMSNPFNSSTLVHEHQDFLSPHLYPEGEGAQDTIDLAAAIAALTTKPIIAGETFTFGPVERLIANTCNDGSVQGWIGQYDGRRLGDSCPPGRNVFGCALYDAWSDAQAKFGPAMRAGGCPPSIP